MNARHIVFALSFLSMSLTAFAGPLSPGELFKLVSPSVVVVKVYDQRDKLLGFGSGMVIANGVVATNCHVLQAKGAQYTEIEHGRKKFDAVVGDVDTERDLCTLKVSGLSAPRTTIGSSADLEVGSKVYAIGSPEGYELTLSDGLVSGKRELGGNQYVQVTAPISHGSSGGGLFNASGHLVGITTLMNTSGQALNFAIPAELLAEVPARSAQRTESPKAIGEVQSPSNEESTDPNARWIQLVAEDKYGNSYYIDSKSLRLSGGNISAWIKSVGRGGAWVEDGKSIYFHEEFIRVTFFCDQWEMTLVESYITDQNGIQLASRGKKDRFSVSPNSSYDPLIDAACSR